jgi:antitoxin component YwqK of YwqJK toxin-antitoxin module
LRKTFQKNETLAENFVNDVKQGWTKWYYLNDSLKKKVFFVDGREEGLSREYSPEGSVITLVEYKKGYIISTEKINRYREGLKHGVWKYFYPDETVKEEGTYSYGKKDGYFKEYDKSGNLLSIHKFANDVEIYDAPELASYEVRTDYYRNGKPKIVASYKDGIPEGIRREYDAEGNVVRSYIFKAGIIIGEGIVDPSGLRQGAWKEFYDGGELYGEGNYTDGKKTGPWKFYYKDGKNEQIGTYNNVGKPDGVWKWFYESGNLKRQEQWKNCLIVEK